MAVTGTRDLDNMEANLPQSEVSETPADKLVDEAEQTEQSAPEMAVGTDESRAIELATEPSETATAESAQTKTVAKAKTKDKTLAKAKAPKEKLSGKEKKARKVAAQVNKALNDLEGRLYQLYQQLDAEPSVQNPLVIGVTSSLHGEGRSTAALALATVLAHSLPLEILLIEADVARPSGLVAADDDEITVVTLQQYLQGEKPLDQLVQPSGVEDLYYIAAGKGSDQALKLLRSDRLDNLFEEMRQRFGVIVVDMPPMLSSTEIGRVVKQVDKVVMVVEAGTTPRKLVRNNLAYIDEAKQGGVLLNRIKPIGPGWFRKLFGS